RRNLRDEAALPHSAAEHRAILKAIASGDAAHAGATMYDHVIESKQRALHGTPAKPKASRPVRSVKKVRA
ncbi:MAG: FCD domain-containing protein, partial [Burkholderiaceae bacterium]